MNKPAEAVTELFDPARYLPDGIGEIKDHQTDLPRIAKDRSLITAIEEKLEQIPTRHDLHLVDARKIDFLEPDSVHLVVTSPPYWTLKEYNSSEAQLGAIRTTIIFSTNWMRFGGLASARSLRERVSFVWLEMCVFRGEKIRANT